MNRYPMPSAATTKQIHSVAATVQITSNTAMTTSVHHRHRAKVTDEARLGD